MSKETIDKAFGGNNDDSTQIDYKAEYEKLQKERELDSIERGRLKKANTRIEELERENAKLREGKREEALKGVLTQQEKDENLDSTVSAQARMVMKEGDDIRNEFRGELDALKAERKAEREAAMTRSREELRDKLDAYCPKFFQDIDDGGDKQAAWKRYKRYNDASIAKAYSDLDFEALKWHIEQFYHSALGVEVPSGTGGSAAPEPSPAGGSHTPIGGGRTYTQDEYSELFDLKEKARDKGDWAEVRRISDEINRAPAEGRVK